MFHRLDQSARQHGAVSWRSAALVMTPNFFAISFGLGGLAGVWRLAATIILLPTGIGDILYGVAAAIFLVLLGTWLTKLILQPQAVRADLIHPLLGPFHALIPLSGIVLTFGLAPYAPGLARLLFLVFFLAMLLLGGWMTGQWALQPMEESAFHPGYFLPLVAGGLVGADVAAHFGWRGLAWMSFGMGLIAWFILSAIILSRLFFQPMLAAAFIPTLAIVVAPPVLAGNAYFTLTQGQPSLPALLFAGYAVVMVLVQVGWIPLYCRLPFTPGWWSFTFSYAAVASYALHWLAAEHVIWAAPIGAIILAAITILIGGISVRTLIALEQGTLLPLPPARER